MKEPVSNSPSMSGSLRSLQVSQNQKPVITERSVSASVHETAVPITIDGVVETAWNESTVNDITLLSSGTVDDSGDLSGTWKTLWDNTYLYVLVEASDDVIVSDSADPFFDDVIELYIDAEFSQEHTSPSRRKPPQASFFKCASTATRKAAIVATSSSPIRRE